MKADKDSNGKTDKGNTDTKGDNDTSASSTSASTSGTQATSGTQRTRSTSSCPPTQAQINYAWVLGKRIGMSREEIQRIIDTEFTTKEKASATLGAMEIQADEVDPLGRQ